MRTTPSPLAAGGPPACRWVAQRQEAIHKSPNPRIGLALRFTRTHLPATKSARQHFASQYTTGQNSMAVDGPIYCLRLQQTPLVQRRILGCRWRKSQSSGERCSRGKSYSTPSCRCVTHPKTGWATRRTSFPEGDTYRSPGQTKTSPASLRAALGPINANNIGRAICSASRYRANEAEMS